MRKDYGETIRIDIYGESHSDEIGVRIQGLPMGVTIDQQELQSFLDRRSPGQKGQSSMADAASTARKEPDEIVFTEGVTEGEDGCLRVDGEVVQACIYNVDRRSQDYAKLRSTLRPGHADIAAYLKGGQGALRPGSGRFSARMTAPMCIAGGICKQILGAEGVRIEARYVEIAGETEPERIESAILAAKQDGDSVGGIIECRVSGYPSGVGGPLYEGLEGKIAQSVFAIPAVKGIEFGAGFAATRMRGSENNDEIGLQDGKLVALTNNAGGINGGISSGMDIVFRVAFKPTPTISKEQRTVDIERMEETTLSAHGRHDACVVLRAMPVVEAATAIALLDSLQAEE